MMACSSHIITGLAGKRMALTPKYLVKCSVVLLCVLNLLVPGLCLLTPVVRTSYGSLRGLRSVSGQNRYYGIPYATSERFQPPREPASWAGVRYAIRRRGPCAQVISGFALGSEDCLRLDVYAPETAAPGHRLPVLVFFHGGAYYYGSKNHYDPEFLVTKNVIAVIANYRVGLLGFLCLNGVANLGLKDQTAVLKWIRKTIAAFGGDPDNVTLCGQSAGASSAAMHMLSEHSKGLFHKLILMSGNPFTPWAFNQEPLRAAFKDAAKRNIPANEVEVYDFLTTSTVDEIHAISGDTSLNPRYFKYSPCVDSNHTDPFFLDTPYELVKSGRFNKVPILTGITNTEGLLFYGLNDDASLKELDDDFVERLPSSFSWCSKKEKKKIAEKLRRHFFGSKKISSRLASSVIDFYSEWIANGTSSAFVDLMVQFSDQPVYDYVFAYEGDRNFAKLLFSKMPMEGASHSDDIFYVFKPAGLSLILSGRDKLFIDRLTTMFTNFMKFGNPTPAKTKLLPMLWPPVTNSSSLSMRLDARPSLALRARTPRDQFYLRLLCGRGTPGYVPCESSMRCGEDT